MNVPNGKQEILLMNVSRREIWLVNLDPTLGAEIRKTRPVVVVNSDSIGALPNYEPASQYLTHRFTTRQ